MKNSIIYMSICLCMIFTGSFSQAEELTCGSAKLKVLAAVSLYNEKGESAFTVFKDPDTGFLFGEKIVAKEGDTYSGFIFIVDFQHVMLMHANNPKLDGLDFSGKKDSKGNLFVEEYVTAAKTDEKGAWVEYFWPKKAGGSSHLKSTFVHPAIYKGKNVVIGCGVFDVSKHECIKQTKE